LTALHPGVPVEHADRADGLSRIERREEARRQDGAEDALRLDVADTVERHERPAPEPPAFVGLVAEIDLGASPEDLPVDLPLVEQDAP
jgi:hypothetical protein